MKYIRSCLFCWLVFVSLGVCHNTMAQESAAANAGTNSIQTQTNTFQASTNNVPFQTNNVGFETNDLRSETSTFNLQTNSYQSQLAGPTAPSAGQVSTSINGTSALAGPPPGPSSPAGAAGLWQAGEIILHAVLTESLIHGNGLEYSPGTQASTYVNEFTPNVILDAGRNWIFSYAPTIYNYSNDKFQDTVNQYESIRGAAAHNDWQFGISQSYANGSVPLVETGEQTYSESLSAQLTASGQLGSDFSVGMNLGLDYRSTENFDTVESWTGGASASYSPAKQLSFNLSLVGGYDAINVGSDIVFESAQAGITFRPRTKLILSLSVGAEDLQFVNPSGPSLLSPVFNASVSYQATKSTSLSLNAGETVSPSFYANQVVTTKGVAASLRQQLAEKLAFALSASYNSEPYTSIEPGPLPEYYLGFAPRTALATVRDDTAESINIGLTYSIGKRITTSIFYTLSENSSGQSNFKYTSSQEGVSLVYRY